MRELRKQSVAELKGLLRETRSRAAEVRFGIAQKKVKNVQEYGTVRREVARILTVLREKRQT